VLVNEFLQCRRRTAADFLNQIIRAGEDTVLMIDGDFTQMLDGEGISLTFGFWFELAIESPLRYAQGVVSDRQRPSLSASSRCSLAYIAPPTPRRG
jgi:hypothetical protein